MFIFKDTGLRANPYAQYTDAEGVTYLRIPEHLIEEVAEPTPPADFSYDLYYRTEQDTAPYVVYTKKPAEQLAQLALEKAKAQRAADVAAIKVTVNGVEFDGDEVAQGRMARAALAMSDTDVMPWVAADASVVMVDKAELLSALRQAGAAMAAIWVRPYQ